MHDACGVCDVHSSSWALSAVVCVVHNDSKVHTQKHAVAKDLPPFSLRGMEHVEREDARPFGPSAFVENNVIQNGLFLKFKLIQTVMESKTKEDIDVLEKRQRKSQASKEEG